MSEQDKHRIEKDALERYPKKAINGFDFPDYNVRERNSYTAGATTEHERMSELLKQKDMEIEQLRNAIATMCKTICY